MGIRTYRPLILAALACAICGLDGAAPLKPHSAWAQTSPAPAGVSSGAAKKSSGGTTTSGVSTSGSTKQRPAGGTNGAAPAGPVAGPPVDDGFVPKSTPKSTPKTSAADTGKGQAPFRDPQLSEPVIRQAIPGVLAAPKAPQWIPLPPEHEKYLDQVLAYWQESSGKIKRYRSKFTRWEYDAVFGPPRDPMSGELPAKTQSTGVIKYASPDKGLFKVEQILHYTPGKKPGEKPQYLPQAGDPGEHWVCDGKSVFSFDHQQKKLLQTELPPEMQGKSIVDGPLPFMFGAESAKIKQRFWIRVITPKEATNEYWLEAVPKMRGDAANFKMLHIIIDAGDFLPKAMAMFNRNYDPQTNPSCTNFVFDKREVNWNETIDKINIFAKEFWEPSTPLGYKKVVENYQPAPDERVSAPAPSTKQATRPGPTRPK